MFQSFYFVSHKDFALFTRCSVTVLISGILSRTGHSDCLASCTASSWSHVRSFSDSWYCFQLLYSHFQKLSPISRFLLVQSLCLITFSLGILYSFIRYLTSSVVAVFSSSENEFQSLHTSIPMECLFIVLLGIQYPLPIPACQHILSLQCSRTVPLRQTVYCTDTGAVDNARYLA